MIKVERKTTESEISVVLDFSPLESDYRKKINTNIDFLNHMIEHIAFRSGINIQVGVKMELLKMWHLIAEDVGITVGRAFYEYVTKCRPIGYGDSVAIIDEAMARTCISFEERTYLDFNSSVKIPESTEGMHSEDILTFIEGFVQGAKCTLHVDLLKGVNGHHIFEAIFRSIGMTLRQALKVEENFKSAGVAGIVNFNVEYNI